jgi:hypothetical protein
MWMLPILAYAQNATPETKAANATDILTLAELEALKAAEAGPAALALAA